MLFGAAILAGCNSEYKEIRNQEAVMVASSDFENQASGLVDKKIALEGTVTHVCKHGGKRFFLGEERIKILASNKLGSFETSLEGSDVYVEGILREERVDEVFLAEWEEELRSTAETQEKEVAHKGEPGHDHAEESAEDPNAAAREQIQNYRQQLADTGKEYLSFFTVEVLSVKEKK